MTHHAKINTKQKVLDKLKEIDRTITINALSEIVKDLAEAHSLELSNHVWHDIVKCEGLRFDYSDISSDPPWTDRAIDLTWLNKLEKFLESFENPLSVGFGLDIVGLTTYISKRPDIHSELPTVISLIYKLIADPIDTHVEEFIFKSHSSTPKQVALRLAKTELGDLTVNQFDSIKEYQEYKKELSSYQNKITNKLNQYLLFTERNKYYSFKSYYEAQVVFDILKFRYKLNKITAHAFADKIIPLAINRSYTNVSVMAEIIGVLSKKELSDSVSIKNKLTFKLFEMIDVLGIDKNLAENIKKALQQENINNLVWNRLIRLNSEHCLFNNLREPYTYSIAPFVENLEFETRKFLWDYIINTSKDPYYVVDRLYALYQFKIDEEDTNPFQLLRYMFPEKTKDLDRLEALVSNPRDLVALFNNDIHTKAVVNEPFEIDLEF